MRLIQTLVYFGGRVLALLVLLAAPVTASWAAAEDFLEYDQAFAFSAVAIDPHTIEVQWRVAQGYYLYHDRISFSAEPGARLGAAQLPPGKIKFDENFGKNVETHRHQLVVRIPVLAVGEGGLVNLVANSQGCADKGLCYPPTEQRAALTFKAFVAPAAQTNSTPAATSNSTSSSAAPATEQGRIEAALKSGSIWQVVSLFAVLGVLLSFTPCVLPMVPILSSIIVGQQGQSNTPMSKSRGLSLAVAYALGMAIVYTAMGVAAGLAGEGLAAALQTPAVLATFATLLVALSFSMFGFYELQLPAALQSKLAGVSNNQKGGSYFGVFVMGSISALIVGPCVAAPLAGALLYISQTGDVFIGAAALFAMACGMSVPLLLVGVSAGSLLPRAGGWMESVKKFFGVLLIAVAIWMVSPIIPAWAHMLAWAALFIVGAAYLSVFDPLPPHASGWRRLWKGVGVVLTVAGVVQIIGVATGGRDVLQPLMPLAGRAANATTANAEKINWIKVANVEELDAALARAAGKPVMLDFYADWCVSCIEMERFTFSDARVGTRMSDMVLLKADVTKNSAQDKALLKRFNLFGPPGIILYNAQGREVSTARVIGFQKPELFLTALDRASQAQCLGTDTMC